LAKEAVMERVLLKKIAKVTALLGAGLASAATLGMAPTANAAANAAAQPASPASWRAVDTITGSLTRPPYLGAIVSTGKTSGYVFESPTGSGYPAAYERTGTSAWKKVPFPGEKGEVVGGADATSPTDVWAFSGLADGGSRVFQLVRGNWKAVKTFSAQIASVTVLGSKDVWVFGPAGRAGGAGLGVYHYNGRAWTRVSGTVGDGYALSAQDVWASTGSSIENYNGHKWTTTSLSRLLPKDKNIKLVDGIIALSAKNVYALESDFIGDETAAIYVLHYDGHTWSKAAESYGFGTGSLSPDGKGGFYFTAFQHDGGSAALLHYYDRQLEVVPPFTAISPTGVSHVTHIPGTTQQLVTGFTHSATKAYAEVFQGS
jgi:hypothetical protein